jgi:hypothetical protein
MARDPERIQDGSRSVVTRQRDDLRKRPDH